jgi:hypothetical protein
MEIKWRSLIVSAIAFGYYLLFLISAGRIIPLIVFGLAGFGCLAIFIAATVRTWR